MFVQHLGERRQERRGLDEHSASSSSTQQSSIATHGEKWDSLSSKQSLSFERGAKQYKSEKHQELTDKIEHCEAAIAAHTEQQALAAELAGPRFRAYNFRLSEADLQSAEQSWMAGKMTLKKTGERRKECFFVVQMYACVSMCFPTRAF